MPLLQNIIDKVRGKKDERYSEMEKNFYAEKKLQERQLSANERELLEYKKKAHEAAVKKELDSFRARQQKDWVHGNQKFLHETNTFKERSNALVSENIHKAARLS